MSVQDLVGQTIEWTSYEKDNSFGFDFIFEDRKLLYIRPAGHGELWLRSSLDGVGTPLDCLGKTIASIDYDGSMDRRSLRIVFMDDCVLECEASGREEVWILADSC